MSRDASKLTNYFIMFDGVNGAYGTAKMNYNLKAYTNGIIGGVDLRGLINSNLFFFADGNKGANWQGASKGFVGDVAYDGKLAVESTSGTVPYRGRIRGSDTTLSVWTNIVKQNSAQATGVTAQATLVSGLKTKLNAAFTKINGLAVTPGFTNRTATSLNGLNTQDGMAKTYVINVTSGFDITTQINITGDEGDVFILRWDTDSSSGNGYQGTVKFSSGGAIVPLGGLKPSNFLHVAGNISASGGGSNPAAPYPQGPRVNDGTGALITGGSDFSGGGFFTGYWLTKGDPTTKETSALSNGIFVGGWYTTTVKFSMTGGTSGVFVSHTGP